MVLAALAFSPWIDLAWPFFRPTFRPNLDLSLVLDQNLFRLSLNMVSTLIRLGLELFRPSFDLVLTLFSPGLALV